MTVDTKTNQILSITGEFAPPPPGQRRGQMVAGLFFDYRGGEVSYSSRSAADGSTLAARPAGAKLAIGASANTMAAAADRLNGSCMPTP